MLEEWDLQSVTLILVFGFWLVVSAVGQFDCRATRWMRSRDQFSLLPRWTFFAPRPGRTDYHLMLQVFHGDEERPWREEHLADRRTLLGAVWNPQKRKRKALSDMVRGIVRARSTIARGEEWRIQYSVPYLALLNYISGNALSEGASHVRFMILESEGFYYEREPWPVFLSARHEVA